MPITQPPKKPEVHVPGFFEKFFAENALAKIGGIFLFLGVLFFLGIIVSALGPVGRIIIGFIAGFIFFGVGVFLDQRGYVNESRTMLGVGILVNYLVILSGRYLLGDGSSNLLSEGVTFVFLILNTVFAIVTSLVYKSKTLLMFSFVFAYLNPFLIGADSDGTPYTLAGYSFIISLGALILSQLYHTSDDRDFSGYLRLVAFIGGNILFLIAPFSTPGHWLIKVVLLGIVSLATIALTYRNSDNKNDIGMFFVMTYVAFGILLIGGGMADVLHTGVAFLGYISFLLVALGATVFVISLGSVASLGYVLFAPLILVFGLLVTGNLFFLIPVILGSLFLYLIIFTLLYDTLSAGFKHVFFVLLCVFLGLSNLSLKFDLVTAMDSTTFLSIVASSLIFLFASYFFSRREKLEYLYSIGTIGTIFLLVPVIETKGEFAMPSVFAIVLFALANILAPFVNRNLCRNDLKNLAVSLVAGILFIGGQLYNFGEVAKLFPGMTLGYGFMGLAALYFALGYAMMGILEVNVSTPSAEGNEARKNTIFGYLGVSISLFSIAILVIFSSQPAIVASIWFFEATILLFFFQKIKDMKIMIAALVLFVVGILKYGVFIESLNSGDFVQLVPLVAIFVSFVLNLKFLDGTEDAKKIPHDVLHLIAMAMVGVGVMNIVPQTGRGHSIFAIAILLAVVGTAYNLYASKLLQYAFTGALAIFYFDHVSSLSGIFSLLQSDGRADLKFLQYATVAIVGGWIYARSRIGGKFDGLKLALYIPFVVYLFVITTQFVYYIFDESIFAITIYWSLWAFAYISTGISKDSQTRRTIGLYLLTLVIFKVLFYDIWAEIDNGIFRVVALMFVGGLMIYISTLYTRKYPGNLMKEFDFGNLTDTLWTAADGDSKAATEDKSVSGEKFQEPRKNEEIRSELRTPPSLGQGA